MRNCDDKKPKPFEMEIAVNGALRWIDFVFFSDENLDFYDVRFCTMLFLFELLTNGFYDFKEIRR